MDVLSSIYLNVVESDFTHSVFDQLASFCSYFRLRPPPQRITSWITGSC